MFHFIRRFYPVIVLGFLVFPMGNFTFVYAENDDLKPLKGTYHFLGQATCAGDDTGFDENNGFPRLGNGGTRTFVQHGEVTYNGNGTGTFTAQVLSVGHQGNAPGNFPIGQANLSCTVTNILNPDGTFTETWQCVTMPTNAGFGFVNNLHAEFPINWQGVIGDNYRKTLHYFNTQTIEEVVTTKDNSDNIVNTQERICNRLAKGIMRESFEDDDDDDD